jgi:riboflavin synthase
VFTGIIEAVGRLDCCERRGGDVRLGVACGDMEMADVKPGDSICVNGVCLTAVALGENEFVADVSAETLQRTLLGELGVGARVNLEKALLPTTRLGGHLVSGHVDGVGTVASRRDDARSVRLVIRAPKPLARFLAEKGSIAVDGTSLTVNEVHGNAFGVNIVPHTLHHTVMGGYRSGTRVHLEVDIVARYLERLLLGERAAEAHGGGLDLERLRQAGFAGQAGNTEQK